MEAIIQTDLSNSRALEWADASELTLEGGQVLVKVKAAGANRTDLLQVAGCYPLPKGAANTLSLEYAGVIEEVKGDFQGRKVGGEVCCLPSGGVYAEKIAVPAGQILPPSHGYSFTETISITEIACMVLLNVMVIAGLKEGDLLLVRGGAGGVGTFAIQMVKRLGARVAVTASSAEKLTRCKELSVDTLINCKEEGFAEVVAAGGDTNVILDTMGIRYLDQNVKAPTKGGHLAIIGMQGGVKGELNIGRLLSKRGSTTAIGLRYRDLADKARIVNVVEDTIWPMFADGTVIPQIHEVMGMRDVAKAHELLDSGIVSDKVVLTA